MPLLQNGRSKSARHTGGNGTPLAVALASSLDGRRGFHPFEARWGVGTTCRLRPAANHLSWGGLRLRWSLFGRNDAGRLNSRSEIPR